MNYFSILLLLTVSGVAVLAKNCCTFPAFSFSAMTNVTQEKFKCSEPISVLCEISVDDSFVAVGISGNLTHEGGTKPLLIKKDVSSVSASLVCDTSSQLWKVDKLPKKYENIGCIMRSSGGVWIMY